MGFLLTARSMTLDDLELHKFEFSVNCSTTAKRMKIIIISLFIQQNSTNAVTNIDTNEVKTGMTRLIALTVTPVY